ncbi:zinc finger HIT domain-containing protein 2 [Sitophilus oryzae]|uniref:Zinc finger HIT domain-containing protein 2 n=1 Tax=Sitophilus oryzae TaxID=7048 RepID=A0A6J2XCV1_SITOR|nr:zinc finger HIT domain-containing protein 2 [Sitophilus oryzae]
MASAKIIELDESNTCKICDNALAKYSCPKCNIIYCSLTCYQAEKHMECSENFYRDNVLEELNSNNVDSSKADKILEILKRTHENNKIVAPEPDLDSDVDLDDIGPFSQFVDIEDLEEDLDSDDEDYIDIAERLAGVNLDDPEQIWEKLTEDEIQNFVSFLKSEDVSKLIPSWQPWWLYSEDKVTEINAGLGDFKNNCPKPGNIKDFSSITNKAPANSVKYNLINILAAYAFTVRYFNGEYFDFANEAVASIATISLTLKKGQNFEDRETSIKSVEQECINSEWIRTDSENLDLMRDDVSKILQGPNTQEKNYYVLCALTDLENLLKEAQAPKNTQSGEKGAFSKQFPNDMFPQVQHEKKENIKKYLRKVEYFQSYAKDVFQM